MDGQTIPHGTRKGHKIYGCQKECCRAADRAYEQHRTRQIAYGRWNPWGDLTAVTNHISDLIGAEWTHAGIAQAAGVAEVVVRDIRHGRKKRIRAEIADKILAVTPRDRRGYVPAAGTTRRLRALALQGHGLMVVADAAGVSFKALSTLRRGERRWAQPRVARAVAVAYERLRVQDPVTDNASAVRDAAVAAGWEPHGAWTRYTIDDPGAGPLPVRANAA